MTPFYDQLVAETRAEREAFCSIPLIRRAVSSGVDRGLYLRFLESAYHHVRHTCPLLGLALSRCGGADERYRAGLLDYLQEEAGHEGWILDDIEALGGDSGQVAAGTGSFAVRVMVGHAYFSIEHVSPYAFLGMAHVLEGMSVALAGAAAEAIGRTLGADRTAGFSYLTSHGDLDRSHTGIYARLLDQIDTADRRLIVVAAARDFYRLYGAVFEELDRFGEICHAA